MKIGKILRWEFYLNLYSTSKGSKGKDQMAIVYWWLFVVVDWSVDFLLLQLIGCCWFNWVPAVDIKKRTSAGKEGKRKLKITETHDWLLFSLIDYLCSWWIYVVFDWFPFSYWHSSVQERVREDSTGARTHDLLLFNECSCCWLLAVIVIDFFIS